MGSCGGAFYALDRADGRVVWKHDGRDEGIRAQFHGDPVVADELVVVGSDAEPMAPIWAFQRRDGAPRWKRAFDGGVPLDLWRRDSTIYAVTARGDVVALAVASGEELWRFTEPMPERRRPPGSPHLDRLLTVPHRSGVVRAFEPATGRLVWERRLPSELNTSVGAHGDSLYVGGMDGTLFRLAAASGEVTGRWEAGGMLYGMLVTGPGCLLTLSFPGHLSCVDPRSMTARWSAGESPRSGEPGWSSYRPRVVGEAVVVGNTTGDLVGYRLADGAELYRLAIGGVLRGIGEEAGVLYVGTFGGDVAAVRLPTSASAEPKR